MVSSCPLPTIGGLDSSSCVAGSYHAGCRAALTTFSFQVRAFQSEAGAAFGSGHPPSLSHSFIHSFPFSSSLFFLIHTCVGLNRLTQMDIFDTQCVPKIKVCVGGGGRRARSSPSTTTSPTPSLSPFHTHIPLFFALDLLSTNTLLLSLIPLCSTNTKFPGCLHGRHEPSNECLATRAA